MTEPLVETQKIAIIGLDAQLTGQENIDQLERAFYQGSVFSEHQSSGSILAAHEQSALALCQSTIDRMAQASQLERVNIAVILLMDDSTASSLNDELAQRYSSCELSSNLADALVGAEVLISKGHAVAILGLSLFPKINSKTSQLTSQKNKTQPSTQQASISFDADFNAYNTFEGISSLLLSSSDFAAKNASYIYSWLTAFDCQDNIELASKAALNKAKINAQQVSLLEVSALGDQYSLNAERSGLLHAYSVNSDSAVLKLNTAISCARSVTGEGGACSEVTGLLKCVMALHQRYIPAISDWQKTDEQHLAAWKASPFYFPVDARPWFPNADGSVHRAAYSCQSDTSYCHIILEEHCLEHAAQDIRTNGFIACSDLHLVLITGNTERELITALDALSQQNGSLSEIAQTSYIVFQASETQATKLRCVLIAESLDELAKEIQQAKTGVVQAIADNSEWKTPKGSYFSAQTVGADSNYGSDDDRNKGVTFLYPGIGATYVGLGRDLFHLFPQIYPSVAALADDIGESLKDKLLSPRSVERLSFNDLKQLDHELRNSLANIAECGVGYACVFTKIFEDVFGIYADFAAGYSMGEVSMYAALGCWQEPGLMSARLAKSDTFNNRLSGELRTLREQWHIELDINSNEKIWETYNVRANVDKVYAALEGEDRVYCTIINTPDSVLIGGYPEDCERVIKKLGVRLMPLNMPNAIHSVPAHNEYPHMEALYTMDVTERIKTKMYSSSCYLPIPHRTKAIANSISKCLCDPVDFPRLVNALSDKGARVFIEMGAGRSLCGWVDKIIDQIHLSVPVNSKGTSDELTFFRALAKLISHGVSVNLESIYKGSMIVQVLKR